MIHGKVKRLNWKNSLEHKRELSEIVLPLVDQIVTRYQNGLDVSAESMLIKKFPQHPDQTGYSDTSLKNSIEKLYLHLNKFDSSQTKQMLD